MKNTTKIISKIIASITATFFLISIINKIIFLISSVNKHQNNLNSYYYQWKFGKIHYTITGNGPAILLVHSLYNGASSFEFSKIIKQLSKNHTIFAIDLIGYGKSEKPKITYTAYLYVQLLHDFIKEVIQERTDVITSGKSNSYVAMLSMQDSININKLIFINPEDLNKLSMNPSTKDAVLKYILETPLIGTMIYTLLCSKSHIKQLFKKHYFINHKKISKKFLNSFYESSHIGESNNKYVYTSNFFNYNNVNIKSALEQLNNSIYIIQGNERNDCYDNIITDYKKANASIESTIINKTKEFPHIEKPHAIFEVLKLFLN